MTIRPDKMTSIAEQMQTYLNAAGPLPFWNEEGHASLNYPLLEKAISVPVSAGEDVKTGRLAGSVDLWIAQEFERAGFGGVWPRITQPRAVDPEIVRVVESLPTRVAAVGERILARSGATDANVMGSVYVKQVDVGLSSWLGGPELLISTKTMGSSFGKNLPNRFEEAYGDVKNLRARYPRAAHGFLFLVNSDIAKETTALQKAIHMLRQLSNSGDVYDAVCLLLADWTNGDEHVCVPSNNQGMVPADLWPEPFFETLIRIILDEAPMDRHMDARSLRGFTGVGLGGAVPR